MYKIAVLGDRDSVMGFKALGLDTRFVEKVEDVLNIGDETWCKVIEIDEKGRVNLSYKDALREIAAASDGRYVPLATAGTAETTLGAIYRRFLRQVAAKEQAEEEELRATERFGFFLVPGLVLLLAAAFLSRGRFSGSVRRKSAE